MTLKDFEQLNEINTAIAQLAIDVVTKARKRDLNIRQFDIFCDHVYKLSKQAIELGEKSGIIITRIK